MKVAYLLRSLIIKQYESESYDEHHNNSEYQYGIIKRYINTLMNLTGSPAHCWLLCLFYVCTLQNDTGSPALNDKLPFKLLLNKFLIFSRFLIVGACLLQSR